MRSPAPTAEQARIAAIQETAISKALDRDAAEQLRDAMIEISEDYYCAGWIAGLEIELWPMLTGGSRHFGMGEVTDEEIAELIRLHRKSGGWWHYVREAGKVFVPTAEWIVMFAAVKTGAT